jgi:PLP dependent protein
MLPAVAAQRIAENLARVQANIEQAAAGRDVVLVCVTKYADDAAVRVLLAAGAEHLGENLLPQSAERFAELRSAGYVFTRHLIGPPQSRKIKAIPGQFDLVQAVDREKVLLELNEAQAAQCPGERLDILLQVNIGAEPQKHGFLSYEVEEAAAKAVEESPALRLRGFMAVPPWPEAYGGEDEFELGTRCLFGQMREIFDKIKTLYPGEPHLDTLSLGMSHDYIWAVETGATMVRVGGALFEGVSEG